MAQKGGQFCTRMRDATVADSVAMLGHDNVRVASTSETKTRSSGIDRTVSGPL